MAKATKKIAVEMTKDQWVLVVNTLDAVIMQSVGIDPRLLGSKEIIEKHKAPKKVKGVVKDIMAASEEILLTLGDAGEL